MYLHLGEQTVVRSEDVIGIFDIENTSISKDTRDFLREDGRHRVVNVSYEMPKSFVVCSSTKQRSTTVYICQISAATLRKRVNGLERSGGLF